MTLDVWSIDVRATACRERRLSALLTDEERARAARFVRPADARRYRIAHGALRTILGGHTGVAPQRIRFGDGVHGKPFVAGGGPRFSLSHSGALALVAVSADTEVGVDVEEVRAIPAAAELARRHADRDTARALVAHPPGGRDVRFMRLWTALEAVGKAEGTGLAAGPDRLELRETGTDGARAWVAGAPSEGAWSIRWLAPAPGHVGAVAVRGGELAVRLRRFG